MSMLTLPFVLFAIYTTDVKDTELTRISIHWTCNEKHNQQHNVNAKDSQITNQRYMSVTTSNDPIALEAAVHYLRDQALFDCANQA